MISQCKQHRRNRQPCGGRDLFQQRFQQAGKQHGAAQKGQHAEHYPILRHEEQRHRRDQRPGGKHLCAAFQGVMSQRHAEAGQQDEHPADGLLPQTPRHSRVPVHPDAEQEHHVPAGMVQHHADQVQPAQLVQQGVTARRGLLLHSSLVFHFPYSPLLRFAIRYDKL